uniref:UNC93-like protein n=1 Tax=Fagus sylvatica TaxID=28930 RepID=A0A2N9HNF2_FAGSY
MKNQFLKSPPPKFRYNSPFVQISLIGLVCFCCPGMYNALSGMGGGGQVDHTAANNANTALFTTFALFGILGGGIYNILGPHLTLFTGCSTYILYAGSFLYYNHHKHQAFAIVAGTLLGIGAGLLWAGQGAIMTSEAASVNDGTYIGFMAFMAAGTLLSLAILPPSKVVRDDGTRCSNIKYSNVSTEVVEILKLFLNWKLLLIVPAAWTRGLNNVFYWGAQMFGSVGIGYIMDFQFSKVGGREGLLGIGVVALFGTAIWSGGLANQLKYSRVLGLLDAMFQSMVYWVIGALADDSEILSRYAGFYKGVQSAGAAVAWQIDTHNLSFMSQLIVNWGLTTISYPLLVILVLLAVKDDNKAEEGTSKEAGPTGPGPVYTY